MILEIDGETYSRNPEDIVERQCVKCEEMFSIKNPKGRVKLCESCKRVSARANYLRQKELNKNVPLP